MTDPVLERHAADLYRGLRFPDRGLPDREGRPFVAVNMIASVDGRAVVGGGARSLGGPLDRLLMRRVRAAADCVLVGAGTLRAEGYDAGVGSDESALRRHAGLPEQPLAAVVTESGDLPPRRGFFRVAGQRAVVLATPAAVRAHSARFESLRQLAEVVEVESAAERLLPEEILDALYRRFAVRRLVVEGGPSLLGDFLAADAVDQLFLTISPQIVGGEQRTIVEATARLGPPRKLALVSAASQAGFLYLKYDVLTYDVLR